MGFPGLQAVEGTAGASHRPPSLSQGVEEGSDLGVVLGGISSGSGFLGGSCGASGRGGGCGTFSGGCGSLLSCVGLVSSVDLIEKHRMEGRTHLISRCVWGGRGVYVGGGSNLGSSSGVSFRGSSVNLRLLSRGTCGNFCVNSFAVVRVSSISGSGISSLLCCSSLSICSLLGGSSIGVCDVLSSSSIGSCGVFGGLQFSKLGFDRFREGASFGGGSTFALLALVGLSGLYCRFSDSDSLGDLIKKIGNGRVCRSRRVNCCLGGVCLLLCCCCCCLRVCDILAPTWVEIWVGGHVCGCLGGIRFRLRIRHGISLRLSRLREIDMRSGEWKKIRKNQFWTNSDCGTSDCLLLRGVLLSGTSSGTSSGHLERLGLRPCHRGAGNIMCAYHHRRIHTMGSGDSRAGERDDERENGVFEQHDEFEEKMDGVLVKEYVLVLSTE
ncbi:hypothetical protein C8J57DRAFT_1382815 [Mycena rebaudengoi]|nr:hypothetical protein C8J57DRAFT_1382815 [Mycena rebaudengoi]